MQLIKSNLKDSKLKKEKIHIQSLLIELGIPKIELIGDTSIGSNFYSRNFGRIDYILHDAQNLYRSKIKEIHPDKFQGTVPPEIYEKTIRLNFLWENIRNRLNSKLLPNKRIHSNDNSENNIPKIETSTKFTKNCLICNTSFLSLRNYQKICKSPTCKSKWKQQYLLSYNQNFPNIIKKVRHKCYMKKKQKLLQVVYSQTYRNNNKIKIKSYDENYRIKNKNIIQIKRSLQKIKDRTKLTDKLYRIKNKELIKQKRAALKERYKEKIKLQNKLYRIKNKEKISAYSKQYKLLKRLSKKCPIS